MLSAEAVISLLALEPLEGEGGFFRQTWIAHSNDDQSNPLGTAIYYLITPDSWSALHRLTHDEVFHFYLGDPCAMVVAMPDGSVVRVELGRDIAHGQHVQFTVPARAWQGTKLAEGGRWALLGTTMAPGFTPEMFELATESSLQAATKEAQPLLRSYLS